MCAWCLTCITSCHSSNGILRCAFGPPFFKYKRAGRWCNQIAKSRSHGRQVTGLWGSRYQVVQDVFSYNVLVFSVNVKQRRGVTSLPHSIAWGWNLLRVCKWTQYLKNSGLAAVCEAWAIHVKRLSNWRGWWLLERVPEGCLLESQLCGRGINSLTRSVSIKGSFIQVVDSLGFGWADWRGWGGNVFKKIIIRSWGAGSVNKGLACHTGVRIPWNHVEAGGSS